MPTNHIGAHPESTAVTGAKPASMRNRQATTARMKLTTWLRVRAEVMLPTLKNVPAMRNEPR